MVLSGPLQMRETSKYNVRVFKMCNNLGVQRVQCLVFAERWPARDGRDV